MGSPEILTKWHTEYDELQNRTDNNSRKAIVYFNIVSDLLAYTVHPSPPDDFPEFGCDCGGDVWLVTRETSPAVTTNTVTT